MLTTTTHKVIIYPRKIRETATIEGSTPVDIDALAFQVLANEVDNRKTAEVAKGIVSRGGFSGINLNYVPVDKALFLLDLLEIGRRKYNHLRQTLLPENKISFLQQICRFAKLIGIKEFNTTISRSSSTDRCTISLLLPGSKSPDRILTTLNPLDDDEYPLTFLIADGLDQVSATF